jgi:hypothetical protein
MSAVNLIKFGNKTITSHEGTRQYRPVFLSDSKGIRLKQERYDPIHTVQPIFDIIVEKMGCIKICKILQN